ncbi:MAG TPA: PASTA domain-containing protein, partial [Solirubrobacteraceae bacterium]|nr:PASTA domain-containing protein [Solirubrobacteraceae bacterium]
MSRPVHATGAVAALALAAAGCGGGASPQRAAPRPVSLEVTAPADAALTRGAAVEVTGRVSPARARVLVAGRPADVAGGTFRATVALREGPNLIDVGASAPRRAGAWVALRVTRQTLVRVPDLVGALRDDAVNELEARGLRPQVSDEDGLLDRLLPGDQRVCATRPASGAEARSG